MVSVHRALSREAASLLEIRPIVGKRELRAFEKFPWTVYRDDPLWVAPLISDRRRDLDPRRGEFFAKGGVAALFGAWRGGRLVGTIAAAEDVTANRREGTRHCMFGFFEYLEDREAAAGLVDAAAAWGRSRELSDMWGPFNFDYENAYGVLVEGRDRPPALLCGHSPPYYLPTMEALGFEPARDDNLAFEVRLDRPVPDRERLARVAAIARKRGGYVVRGFDPSRYEEAVDEVCSLLNVALRHLKGFVPYERSSVDALLSPFRRFADPELVLFAEKDGNVIGFFPAIPNLNEALIDLGGLRRPWDWLRLPFAFNRRWRSATIKSVLVHPDHWGRGVAAILFEEMLSRLEARGQGGGRAFDWLDLSLTSADNPQTPILAGRFGGRIYKRYRVFSKRL
ncbi:MAG TPA: GNAT family N-acetyltransferase [Rectinemataceae bacterium]|nr:GNAT family N-acetyltransferase [Rectinemataceae bacterium]